MWLNHLPSIRDILSYRWAQVGVGFFPGGPGKLSQTESRFHHSELVPPSAWVRRAKLLVVCVGNKASEDVAFRAGMVFLSILLPLCVRDRRTTVKRGRNHVNRSWHVCIYIQPTNTVCMYLSTCVGMYICTCTSACVWPSLSSVTVWRSSVFRMFGSPTYEVSARYIKQSPKLDTMCQPNGGGEEFRQGNLSGILNFRIKSGPHGNIQLLPPGDGPCVYKVTVSYEPAVASINCSCPNQLPSAYTSVIKLLVQ